MSTIIAKLKKESIMEFPVYGLCPVITGLIIYTAIKFTTQNDIIYVTCVDWISLAIIFFWGCTASIYASESRIYYPFFMYYWFHYLLLVW